MVALPLLLLYNLSITPEQQPIVPADFITQDTTVPVSPDGLIAGGVASGSAIDLLVAVENAFASSATPDAQSDGAESSPTPEAPAVQVAPTTTTQLPPSTTVAPTTSEAGATTQPTDAPSSTLAPATTTTTQAPPTTSTPPTTTTTAPPVTTTTTVPVTTTTTATNTGSPIAPYAWDPSWPEVAMWDHLAVCESTSRWSANTGNGYYGGIQFSVESWAFVGGTGRPDRASRAEQIYRGALLWEIQSWGAWPGCTNRFGWSERQTSL